MTDSYTKPVGCLLKSLTISSPVPDSFPSSILVSLELGYNKIKHIYKRHSLNYPRINHKNLLFANAFRAPACKRKI